MAAPPALVGDVLEARFVTRMGDQLGLVIRHYVVDSVAGGGQDLQQIADEMDTDEHLNWKAAMNQQAEWRGVGLRRLVPAPTIEYIGSSVVGAGTGGISALPGQVTGVITLRSDLPGRANRGRMFIPFPSEDDADLDGGVAAAYVTKLNTIAARHSQTTGYGPLVDEVILRPVIFQRVLVNTVNVTSHIARAKWGTQRRRGDYGSTNLLPF